MRDTTVTLPEGVELSPAAANGLEACSEAQIGFTGLNQTTRNEGIQHRQPACPDASKVGLVHIQYAAAWRTNSKARCIWQAPPPTAPQNRDKIRSTRSWRCISSPKTRSRGCSSSSPAKVTSMNAACGYRRRFDNAPQVPFEDLKLELFGGQRASLTHAGVVRSLSRLKRPLRRGLERAPSTVSSPAQEFDISTGANGSGCSGSPLAFSPGFVAQSTDSQAGAFTDFALELSRPDGDQALSTVSMHLPQGNAALLSRVKLCSEAQAKRRCVPARKPGRRRHRDRGPGHRTVHARPAARCTSPAPTTARRLVLRSSARPSRDRSTWAR